jgi:tight adherence protein B
LIYGDATMNTLIILGVGIFVVTLCLIQMFLYALRGLRKPEAREIRKRLRALSKDEAGVPDILKKNVLVGVPIINRILVSVPGVNRFRRLWEQANAQYSMGWFLLLMATLALAGYAGCSLFTRTTVIPAATAVLTGGIPIFYLRLKKKKRVEKFKRQLPEGLDLIARALRAGHAFTSGMELVAEEFDDPLGPEFDKTLDEINFGVSVQDALKSLGSRIDCPDLKYFVVSVIVQRETGGNLAEIIETIARLIRERFRLEGKIKTLTAEGRLSALILSVLPFMIVFALLLLNPGYINSLFKEPVGRVMVGIAAIMMLFGMLMMRRMARMKL